MDTGTYDLTSAETLEVFIIDSRLLVNLTKDELGEVFQERIDKILKRSLSGCAKREIEM